MTTPIDVQPVILAGGSGTRLWPLSRGDYPKQLLRLDGDSTMLQRTALRVMGEPQKNVLDIDLSVRTPSVVCGEDLRFLIVEQMRAIGDGKAVVMLEAAPRNTGPAVAAAAALAAQGDGDPVLIIMPADHVIRDEEQFRLVLRKAAALCLERPVIATFGIVPTRADTGLGYIRRGDPLDGVGAGAFALAAFEEKPNAERAMLLLD
ncbi:MAG: NTP transferase domain-containing protein, partial [Chromatiales bacterium]|nr:NTP transferase domain-containing protein [Chromatiales bacterium]